MLHLLELRAFKDDGVGHFLIKRRLPLGGRADDQFEAVAVRRRAHKIRPLAQPTRRDKCPDLRREHILQSVAAHGREQPVEPRLPLRIERLVRRPSLDALHRQKPSLHPVDDVIERVSRIVRPVHDLALHTFERIQFFSAVHLRWDRLGPKNKTPNRPLRII